MVMHEKNDSLIAITRYKYIAKIIGRNKIYGVALCDLCQSASLNSIAARERT